jgi:PhoH-like ATPase
LCEKDNRKNYVLDTNVLMHDPWCFRNFYGNNVYIPVTVLEELDHLKTREGIAGYQAREAVRTLHRTIDGCGRQCVSGGIELDNGIRLLAAFSEDTCPPFSAPGNDNAILACAMRLREKDPDSETILVSKDVCVRIKAEICGITSQDYETDKIKTDELYSGQTELTLSAKAIDKIFKEGVKPPKDAGLLPNEFVRVKSGGGDSQCAVARFDGAKLVPLKYDRHTAWGLRPLNLEQKMAFELLMDPQVPFVSITGGAGSGKTILATAVALEKVLEQREYRKLVFVRPTVPAGNDIGYLPGSEEEKLRPWMGSFYDAIDNLMSSDKDAGKAKKAKKTEDGFQVDAFIDDFRRRGIFEIKTFTYMRGRTIADAS